MLDIIIPAYKANNTISKTLKSIERQSMKDKIRVVIVNDNPNDDYTNVIDCYKNTLDVTIINNPLNLGTSGARFEGFNNSSSEFVLFCDADDEYINFYSLEKMYNDMVLNENIVCYSFGLLQEKKMEISMHQQHTIMCYQQSCYAVLF